MEHIHNIRMTHRILYYWWLELGNKLKKLKYRDMKWPGREKEETKKETKIENRKLKTEAQENTNEAEKVVPVSINLSSISSQIFNLCHFKSIKYDVNEIWERD